MSQASNNGSNSSSGSGGLKTVGSQPRAAAIDVQELSERVYRLFLADLEVQRKRLHGTRR